MLKHANSLWIIGVVLIVVVSVVLIVVVALEVAVVVAEVTLQSILLCAVARIALFSSAVATEHIVCSLKNPSIEHKNIGVTSLNECSCTIRASPSATLMQAVSVGARSN